MNFSTFGRNDDENMKDRYNTTRPLLNLLSNSQSRTRMENERTNNKPLDHRSAFSLQSSNLKPSKRLDENNFNSDSGDRTCPPFQPHLRLLSQDPSRLSTPYFSTPIPRKSSPIPATSPVASTEVQKTDDNRVSSPFLMSQEFDSRAYTQSKLQRSVSTNPPQASFRASSLKRPDTHKSPVGAGPGHPAQATWNQHFDDGVLLNQVNALLANKNQLQNQIDKLDECRSQLASTMSQLESTSAKLVKTETSFASSKEKIAALESEHISLRTSLSEAKSELDAVSGDRERLREAHSRDRAENDQLRKRLEKTKKGLAALRERCDTRDMDFAYLQKAHDVLRTIIDNTRREADESKSLTTNALAVLEPLMDSHDTLTRVSETRSVLKELQEDLAASQRVTDLLRDKLYNQSSLLVEARDRIRDLEEEKRSSLEEVLQGKKESTHNTELLSDVGIKWGRLAEKFASRELETIDVLANSAALATELEVLKKASEANNIELAALRVMKEESISKLLASQGVINVREKEIISLKAEVKALGESKAELRALLAEAKKLLGEKEVELRAKDPNWDLEFKIKEFDAQVTSLKAALHTCQETLQIRETEIQRQVHETARLNAELVLSKTTTATLRDDLEGFRSKEASTTCKYEMLLAEVEQVRKNFRSQEHALLDSKAELKVELYRSKEESSKLKTAVAVVQEQKASVDALVNVHAQRASSAEKAASLIETQFKEAQATIVDLTIRLQQAEAELKSVQETSVISEQTISSTLHERASELEKAVKDLEQQNEELSRRSVDILLRYQQGTMDDIEKSFVAYIMKNTRDILEQGVVAKDHELRRRETMIQALQAKIGNLEVTIARMIKEKGDLKEGGPLVAKNLNRWLPQSPADAETTIHSPEDGAVDQNFVTPITTTANPSAPLKPADIKFSQFDCSGEDDSEDDIPLSDLPRSVPDNQYVGLKRTRTPSPVGQDEEPTRPRRRSRASLVQKPIPPRALASPIPAPVASSSTSVKKVTGTVMTATAKNRQKKLK